MKNLSWKQDPCILVENWETIFPTVDMSKVERDNAFFRLAVVLTIFSSWLTKSYVPIVLLIMWATLSIVTEQPPSDQTNIGLHLQKNSTGSDLTSRPMDDMSDSPLPASGLPLDATAYASNSTSPKSRYQKPLSVRSLGKPNHGLGLMPKSDLPTKVKKLTPRDQLYTRFHRDPAKLRKDLTPPKEDRAAFVKFLSQPIQI